MYFSPREWLELAGICGGLLLLVALPVWLLIRGGRRYLLRERAALLAKPLVSYSIDLTLAQQFLEWRIRRIAVNRRAMGRRLPKIAAWITGLLTLGLGIMGAVAGKLIDGLLLGLAFSAIIMASVVFGVGLVALISQFAVRKLRRTVGQPAQVCIGLQGVVLDPGEFQPHSIQLWQVGWHNDTPTVLEIVSRSSAPKGGYTYRHVHAPVPQHEVQRVNLAIAPLKEKAAGQR